MGLYNSVGAASYTVDGQRFTLTFPVEELTAYPDQGCNTEVFVGRLFLELESLGQVQTLYSGGRAMHTERWRVENV